VFEFLDFFEPLLDVVTFLFFDLEAFGFRRFPVVSSGGEG
jgi:hypothetical protein